MTIKTRLVLRFALIVGLAVTALAKAAAGDDNSPALGPSSGPPPLAATSVANER